MKKKKEDEDPLEKLIRLTKVMKKENVKVAPKGPPRAVNKWRSQDPKFGPKAEKPTGTVNAGGMDIDPSLKADYEAWRKEKEEEQKWRREAAARKRQADAAREAEARRRADNG
jgi:hypothetical protein